MIQKHIDHSFLQNLRQHDQIKHFLPGLNVQDEHKMHSMDEFKKFILETLPDVKVMIKSIDENHNLINENFAQLDRYFNNVIGFFKENSFNTLEKKYTNSIKEITKTLKEDDSILDLPQQLDLGKFRCKIRENVVNMSNELNSLYGKDKNFKLGREFIKISDKILSLYGYLKMDQKLLNTRCFVPLKLMFDQIFNIEIDAIFECTSLDKELFNHTTKPRIDIENLSDKQVKVMVENQLKILHKIIIEKVEQANLFDYKQVLIKTLEKSKIKFELKYKSIKQDIVQKYRKKKHEKVIIQDYENFKKKKQEIKDKVFKLNNGKALTLIDTDYLAQLPNNSENYSILINTIDEIYSLNNIIDQMHRFDQEIKDFNQKLTNQYKSFSIQMINEIQDKFQIEEDTIDIQERIQYIFDQLKEIMNLEKNKEKDSEIINLGIQNQLNKDKNNVYLQEVKNELDPEFKHENIQSERKKHREIPHHKDFDSQHHNFLHQNLIDNQYDQYDHKMKNHQKNNVKLLIQNPFRNNHHDQFQRTNNHYDLHHHYDQKHHYDNHHYDQHHHYDQKHHYETQNNFNKYNSHHHDQHNGSYQYNMRNTNQKFHHDYQTQNQHYRQYH